MLEGLFGNKSAEKVMVAIMIHGELHASAIAQYHHTALDPIKKQLERFEEAGYLTSRVVGRSRLYKFNDEHPLMGSLKQLLGVAVKQKTKYKKIELNNQG